MAFLEFLLIVTVDLQLQSGDFWVTQAFCIRKLYSVSVMIDFLGSSKNDPKQIKWLMFVKKLRTQVWRG